MTKAQSKEEILQGIYKKLGAEIFESMSLFTEDTPREHWVFSSALLMFLSALQMQDKAREGALFVVVQYVTVNGLDWYTFKKSALETIKLSDPRFSYSD